MSAKLDQLEAQIDQLIEAVEANAHWDVGDWRGRFGQRLWNLGVLIVVPGVLVLVNAKVFVTWSLATWAFAVAGYFPFMFYAAWKERRLPRLRQRLDDLMRQHDREATRDLQLSLKRAKRETMRGRVQKKLDAQEEQRRKREGRAEAGGHYAPQEIKVVVDTPTRRRGKVAMLVAGVGVVAEGSAAALGMRPYAEGWLQGGRAWWDQVWGAGGGGVAAVASGDPAPVGSSSPAPINTTSSSAPVVSATPSVVADPDPDPDPTPPPASDGDERARELLAEVREQRAQRNWGEVQRLLEEAWEVAKEPALRRRVWVELEAVRRQNGG